MGISDLRLYAGLWSAACLCLGVGLCMDTYLIRASRRPVPLPAAALAAATAAVAAGAGRAEGAGACTRARYERSLLEAAQRYRVPEVSVAALQQPLRGGVEFRGARALSGRQRRLKTAHLMIEAQKVLLPARDGSSDRVPHLLLTIHNRAAVPLAYRVLTRVAKPEGCLGKQELPHDALVLKPRETIRRSECLAGGGALTVTQVEVYEVTPLGQRFLSRQEPYTGGPFDLRVASAHDRRGLAACGAQSLQLAGPEDWRRLIDFYARHDCDEFAMPKEYRPFAQPGQLPACEGGAAPQEG